MGDLYRPGASLDYPVGKHPNPNPHPPHPKPDPNPNPDPDPNPTQVGGSGAVIDALVRGIERHGGTVRLSTHVEP